MKKNIKTLAVAFALSAMVAFTACKKETVETVDTDVNGDTTTVVTTTTTENVVDVNTEKAEADLKAAKDRLQEAIAKGDKKAEEAAQKAVTEAEAAWNNLKSGVNEGADKTKAALEDAKNATEKGLENTKAKLDAAADKTKANLEEAKADSKAKYNEMLEKAKAK